MFFGPRKPPQRRHRVPTVPNCAQPSRPTFCQPWSRDMSIFPPFKPTPGAQNSSKSLPCSGSNSIYFDRAKNAQISSLGVVWDSYDTGRVWPAPQIDRRVYIYTLVRWCSARPWPTLDMVKIVVILSLGCGFELCGHKEVHPSTGSGRTTIRKLSLRDFSIFLPPPNQGFWGSLSIFKARRPWGGARVTEGGRTTESLAGTYIKPFERAHAHSRALSRAESVEHMARTLATARREAPLATLDHEDSRCCLPNRRVRMLRR